MRRHVSQMQLNPVSRSPVILEQVSPSISTLSFSSNSSEASFNTKELSPPDSPVAAIVLSQQDLRMSRVMKYTSLGLLTLQNALLILVMRYTRTRTGSMFMATTAVIMSEILKVVTCIIIIFVQEGGVTNTLNHLNRNIVQQPVDCLKISIPAIIYMVQNNLLYVAVSNLEASTFQVTYQLKILTTALFSVAMLQKKLSPLQWISLVCLFLGIATVQLSPNNELKSPLATAASIALRPEQNYIVGLLAVVVSACLSGFAGVYFEKLLKGTPQSLYVRNVQLGVIGIVFGIAAMFLNDGQKVIDKGFFFGYDIAVWLVIFLQSLGGIMIAVVIKYADNILKGFATSCAIVISCIMSIYLFDFQLSLLFTTGTVLVIISVYMYSKFVPVAPAVVRKAVASV